MSDWVTLFEGSRESAESLADLLRARDLETFLEDRVERVVRHKGLENRTTRVLIEPSSLGRASAVLESWEGAQAGNVEAIARRMRRVLVWSLFPIGIWILGAFVSPSLVPAVGPMQGGIVWIVSLIAVSQLDEFLQNRRNAGHTA